MAAPHQQQESGDQLEALVPVAIYGFDGKIAGGLHVHPDRKHVVFPLGNKLSVLNVETNHQQFLSGHTNAVSCVDVSKKGTFIASGQVNHMGFRAYVIVWDWESKRELFRHEMHKVRVEMVCFTSNELCLCSLGGRDDGMLIVWDLARNAAICSKKATSEIMGEATQTKCLQRRGSDFFTGGDQNLRLWTIDRDAKKLTFEDVKFGKLRRDITSMSVNSIDSTMYVGTMSGDVCKIWLNCHHDPSVLVREKAPILLGCFGRHNPKKQAGKDCELWANGVRALLIVTNERLVVGAGDGTVEMLKEREVKVKEYPSPTWPQFKLLKRAKVNGAVTSIQQLDPDTIVVGTDACEIYALVQETFALRLLVVCNTSAIYDIAFPKQMSAVFATAAHQFIRVWSTANKNELLRITVPNYTCAAICFTADGKSIVSAWNDGCIRAFTPLTGCLIYAIPNAHNKGCTALAMSANCRVLVSGGLEGQVRVWRIEPTRQSLVGVLKEHRGTVSTIDFNCFNSEVVSASVDGTCVIWDIARMQRKAVLYANTQFTCARYYPNGVQIIATGSDRLVSWWEVYDASKVRECEASAKGPINQLALNVNGEHFVSVGSDQLVKLWNYQEGVVVAEGVGHAGVIVSAAYSPDGRLVVTGSADGTVFVWAVPQRFWLGAGSSERAAEQQEIGGECVVVSATKPASGRKSGGGKAEHIDQLESCRSRLQEVVICECPEVDANCPTDVNEACVYVEQQQS